MRLEPWKVLLGVAVALIGAGAAWASWERDVAKLEDVEAARAAASTALTTHANGTNIQLGALQTQVQDLRVRQSAVEAQLNVLTSMTQRLLDQTLAIARATGAKQSPP